MPTNTTEELARMYVARLKDAKVDNKELEADRIRADIENIRYENTDHRIRLEDKEDILDKMEGMIDGTYYGMLQDSDNRKHLALIAQIRASIKGTKK